MQFSYSFSLNFYTLFLLIILLLTMLLKREVFKFSSKLLEYIIIITSFVLVFEVFSWIFDGINTPFAWYLNYFFNALFFFSGSFIVALFVSYTDYLIYHNKSRVRKRYFYLFIPVIFLIMLIINFFTPILFSINSENVYQREPLMNLAFGIVFAMVFYMMIQAILNRKNMDKDVFYSLLVICFIPLIGGVLQSMFYGLLIMWSFLGLAVVIAYIFTERTSNSRDYLTRVYTRMIMDEYLTSLIDKNIPFAMIILDIDNFKGINDTYGHKMGDRILIDLSHMLRHSIVKDTMVARIGGDEFMIACILNDDIYMRLFLDNLKRRVKEYNQDHPIPMAFSKGIAIRDIKSQETYDQLFIRCDEAMYLEKQAHKNLNQSK